MSPDTVQAGRRRRRLRLALFVYLGLLLVSHLWSPLSPETSALEDDEFTVELPSAEGTTRTGAPVRLVYLDRRPADLPEAPTLLLVHGSPGSKRDFAGLMPTLSARFRTIVPDLPGFGRSTRRVPDYSVAAHARYLDALLGRLGVRQVHVVAFSMGGGVALELYALRPERVRSVTLLSAIGVQELELLGDYHLNHAIHGVQLAGLWLLHAAVPHMGLLDDALLSREYGRNFFDTDQRPLRGILAGFQPPMLIVHGDDDFLVPPAAAREHHRLVPQSELQMLDGSHFMVFTRGEELAGRVGEFIERVECGHTRTREQADPERLAAAGRAFDPSSVPPAAGFSLFVVMLMLAVGTFVSEDLTCVTAGLLAAHGRLGFLAATSACVIGILIGDILLYLAGRWIGRPALGRAPLRWVLGPERVAVSSRWFDRRGPVVILMSRFLPGTRLATYFAAGMLHTSFARFALFFLIAVLLWTPAVVGLSMGIGAELLGYLRRAEDWLPWLVPALAVGIVALLKLVVPLFSWRGRRMLVGRWRRIVRWEFWPPWILYPPLIVYVLGWLGIVRHRAWLLFTAANPAIEAGGYVSESKSEILRGLGDAEGMLARFLLIPAGLDGDRRLEIAREFMDREGLDLPVVLKPDRGQRGSGVEIIRSFDRLETHLRRVAYDVILQEYAPGLEFGVFYYRLPSERRGRIFSVTEKRMPAVVGDGHSTLERLILSGPRSVAMARLYLARHARDLERVPDAGERVQLVEIGTHCRGAVFVDGGHLVTSELEETIDRISRNFDGFYFGRYDIRVPTTEDLRAGRNLKVIELNGVTSEATHIYDPKFSALDAYRVLFRQWRLAFRIAEENRERGARPSSAAELLRLKARYWRISRAHPE